MKNRKQVDVPLQSTNTYEAWCQVEAKPSVATRVRYLLFDGQTVTFDGTNSFNMLPKGELPDGRIGDLLGVYVRPLRTTVGQTLSNVDAIWEVMTNYFLRVSISDTVVCNIQCLQLPPFGSCKIYGDDNLIDGAGGEALVPVVEGRGIPFDRQPINENETIQAELYCDGGHIHLQTAVAVGLVVSDVRRTKKAVE